MMKRSFLTPIFAILGLIASAGLDTIPRRLNYIRIVSEQGFFYLRWVNVIPDILFASIIIFVLWWVTAKEKPNITLSILFLSIGFIMLSGGSPVIYTLPQEILHLLPSLIDFYIPTCSPNNLYFLSYSGVIFLIGLKGVIQHKPHIPEKPLSVLILIAGGILCYGLDMVYRFANRETAMAHLSYMALFPLANLFFALILMLVGWWMWRIKRPSWGTLIFSLISGIFLFLYKSPILPSFPKFLIPRWYVSQIMDSMCSPYSFTLSYGAFIMVLALLGLIQASRAFRNLSNSHDL